MGDRILVQGFYPDPARGLPLQHALTFFAAYPDLTDANGQSVLASYHRLRMGPLALGTPLTPCEQRELRGLRTLYLERIAERLRAGTLVLRGFRPGSPHLEELPSEWFTNADFDVEANTVQANGLTISGVLIFSPSEFPVARDHAEPAAEPPPEPDLQQPTNTGESGESPSITDKMPLMPGRKPLMGAVAEALDKEFPNGLILKHGTATREAVTLIEKYGIPGKPKTVAAMIRKLRATDPNSLL